MDRQINIAILTISDTRTFETDKSGQIIHELVDEHHHIKVIDYEICKDDIRTIRKILTRWSKQQEIDIIITTGGTGIAKRDCTIEAVQPLLEKEITGFGELFRFLSFTEDVGTRALLSRAVAGVIEEKVVFVLPGSSGAVRLAINRLIVPEMHHLVDEATRHLNWRMM